MQEHNEILKELEGMKSKLGSISRRMPYYVPDDYFENAATQILTSARAKDVTAGLADKTPFEVPNHYFDQLPLRVLENVKEKRSVKIIPLGRQIRLAAAAMLLLLAGAGFFKIALQQNSFDKKLSALPDDAIKEYVLQTSNELNIDNTVADTKVPLPEHLTEAEIVQYLDETGWQ